MALSPPDPDTIDDILYSARTNSPAELTHALAAGASATALSPRAVLEHAIDADSGNSALHMAAANGHHEALRLLLATLDVRLPPPDGASPEEVSTAGAASQLAHPQPSHPHSQPSHPHPRPQPPPLLDHANAAGNTALHWAALNGHVAATRLLLAAGADAAVRNGAGRDALAEAERGGRDEVVALLEGWGDGDGGEGGEVDGEVDGVDGVEGHVDAAEESSRRDADGVEEVRQQVQGIRVDGEESGS